jgi:hypothetical protein
MSKSKAAKKAEPGQKQENLAKPGSVGIVSGKDTLYLRMEAGTATGDGAKYELSVNMGGLNPIIHSSKTGKWWTITWPDLMKLAQAAGIDEPIKA